MMSEKARKLSILFIDFFFCVGQYMLAIFFSGFFHT